MKISKRAVLGSFTLLLLTSIGIIVVKRNVKTEKPPVVRCEKNEFFTKEQVIEDIDFALNSIK